MKELLSYLKRKWLFLTIVTILVIANLYIWIPILKYDLIRNITPSSLIAIIISMVSLGFTFYNFRFNRKLQTAQRFNLAYERYQLLHKRYFDFVYKTRQNIDQYDNELLEIWLNNCHTILELVSKIEVKYFMETTEIEKYDAILIEQAISDIIKVNTQIDDIERAFIEKINLKKQKNSFTVIK